MERSKRRRLGAERGRALIERLGRSGLSVSAFCEREGISRTSLYRWRSIVANGGRAQPKPAPTSATPATEVTRPGFIELGALAGESSRIELKLDLGAGVLLHLVRG
jgi:transposase-like protein